MSIDASIYSNLQSPKMMSLADLMQLRQQHQAGEQQLQIGRQQIASNQALEEERRQTIAERARAAAEMEAYRQAIGNPDLTPESILEQVRIKAPGHYDELRGKIEAHEKSAAELKLLNANLAKANQEALTDARTWIGSVAEDIAASNYDPTVAEASLKLIERNVPDFKPQADNIRKQLIEGGPPALKAIVDKLRPKQKPVELNKDTTLVDPVTGAEIAKGPHVDEHSPAYKEWKDYQATGGTDSFDAYMTKDANRKRPVVNVNTPTGGDFAKEGSDFLASVPAQWRNTVKKIGDYDVDISKVTSTRTGERSKVAQWVYQYNPGWDQAQFTSRAPMRKAFTSGPQAQAINSLNTAIGHLDQFVGVAQALGNGSFRPGNELWNWAKTTFGDSAPTNFAGIKSIMAGELASAFKKSGATDQEIASVQSAINGSNSPTQLTDYATKIAIPALGSKIATYNSQYRQVMGEKDPFKVLTPDAESVLQKYGFDPAHPTMGGAPPAPAGAPKPTGGLVKMQSPDGKHTAMVPADQVDAAKAKGAKVVP